MKIGDEVYVHGYVDEIRKDTVIIRNDGGYFGTVKSEIVEAPTIDAVSVRHGKWIDIDEQTYTWKVRCSCCGNERSMVSTQGKYPNYCETCGARMDEE